MLIVAHFFNSGLNDKARCAVHAAQIKVFSENSRVKIPITNLSLVLSHRMETGYVIRNGKSCSFQASINLHLT